MAPFRRSTALAMALALALAPLLSACSQPRAPHGGLADQRLVFSSAPDIQKASITTALRTFNDEGKLGLCGAVVIVGQDDGVEALRARLRDPSSRLLIGDLGVSPLFLNEIVHRASQLQGGSIRYRLGSLPEKCTRAEVPWDAEWARKSFKLSFTK